MELPVATFVHAAANYSGATFPNHDCLGLASPVVDWDRLHAGLKTACKGHTRETRTLQCSAQIPGWQDHTLSFLQMHRPWEAKHRLDFEAFEAAEPAAQAECPLGVLMLSIAKTLLCAEERSSCYMKYTLEVSAVLYALPLTVVMGTRWPIFALLNSYDWQWPGLPIGSDYDCGGSSTTLDWRALRQNFEHNPDEPRRNWWLTAIRFVFDMQLASSMYVASRECLYGVYVANIVKAMWAADTESSSYTIYAPYVSWVLYESLHYLGATRWPLFALLHHFSSLRRHGFQLDFTDQELGALPYRDSSAWLQQQPLEQHVGSLEMFATWQPHLASVVWALKNALRNAGSSRMVYVTMVYGSFNKYISGWAHRLRRLGIGNLVMAALDPEAYRVCTIFHGELCVTGTISAMNKYTLLLIALQLGIDVMWLDFDIFLVQNPTAAIVEAAKDADVVIAYDYITDCVCNGFFFIRALPSTHLWLFEIVRWLYNHPYEHDQRAISAFLNYTEKIAISAEEMPQVPRWNVFEEANAFISFGPWAGNFQELLLVHFVDGSAFSLYGRPDWDPSVPAHKRKGLEKEAAASSDQSESGIASVSPMDAFYGDSAAIDAAPEAFWEVAPKLRQLMESQVRPPPAERQPCGILPDVHTAHKGLGFIAEQRRQRQAS